MDGDYSTGSYYALNPQGTTNWTFFNSAGNGFATPAIGADGTLYFATADSYVYAVSSNGSLAWSYQTGRGIISSPVIGADGTVYVASEDGYLYALFGSTPLATNAPWPMFHQNPAHTGLQSPATTPAAGCDAPFVYDAATNGAGEFSFRAVAGTNDAWNVYASTNLSTWTEVLTNLPFSQSVDAYNWNATFTDTNVTGVSQRFYQLSNSGCSSRVIGFVNLNIVPGTNLIADQFDQVSDMSLDSSTTVGLGYVPANTLNDLFPFPYYDNPQSVAFSGTQIMKWNGSGFDVFTFGLNPTFGNYAWNDTNEFETGVDATMLPGVGVLMNNPTGSSFGKVFMGLIRQQQIFQIRPGTNYLSSTVPRPGAITNITGYIPHNGDVIRLWNTTNQAFNSYTNSSGVWAPTNPAVNVGEGFVLVTSSSNTWTNTWQP